MAGKGDRRRPFDRKKWDEGWERLYAGKPISTDLENELIERRKELLRQRDCKHPGCRSHVSHPCKECGYQRGTS